MTTSLSFAAVAALLALATGAQAAETPAPAKAAKPMLQVHAPNAQALVKSIGAAHKDIFLLGVHANLPGSQDNAIVGCTDAARVGKPSSPGDMALIGKPKIMVARLDAKHVYEVAMSLSDAQGRSVGMMVDQMPIDQIADEADALKRALAVRAELQRKIPTEAWFFEGN